MCSIALYISYFFISSRLERVRTLLFNCYRFCEACNSSVCCVHRSVQILMMMSCWSFSYVMAWQLRWHKLLSSPPWWALCSATLTDLLVLSQLTLLQGHGSSLSPLSCRRRVTGRRLGHCCWTIMVHILLWGLLTVLWVHCPDGLGGSNRLNETQMPRI